MTSAKSGIVWCLLCVYGQGIVFLNGFIVGRYWNLKGPQVMHASHVFTPTHPPLSLAVPLLPVGALFSEQCVLCRL